MTDPIHRRDALLPAGAAASAALLEPALAEAAGADASPVSLTLDYGAATPAGQSVRVEAWVDRSTRSLVFAHGRVLRAADDAVVMMGSAIFRRGSGA